MAYDDKSAYALCIFSLAVGPNSDPITFLGKTPVCSLLSSFYDNEIALLFLFQNTRFIDWSSSTTWIRKILVSREEKEEGKE